jgi:glutathione peroxidase-family protein
MRKTNLFLLFFVSLALCLSSCSDKKHFKVEGSISDASGSVLYLEKDGLLKTSVVDSCVLKSDGSFSFKAGRPDAPEFYRLRIKNSDILFAIDSCEHISVKASAKTMASQYSIEGSLASSNIKELRFSLIALQNKVTTLLKQRNPQNEAQITAELDTAINQHKKLAKKIVLQNPLSPAAYYAIFQQVNGYNLFTPYDKEDRRYCAAVATAFYTYHPKAERTLSLYNFVMQAIVADRQARNQQTLSKMMQTAKADMIDVEMTTNRGQVAKLSDLKGKTVILDFTIYQVERGSEYILALRDLYNKYHAKGLEIYQISLDPDIDFWRQASQSLPWICVHGTNGTPAAVSTYNVTNLPTRFLISKDGSVVKRNPTEADVQKAVE